jgi:hypothetical protein
MSENRFASEEFVVEVATWLERVARECNVGAPFRSRGDGSPVTTSGVFFAPANWPQEDWQSNAERVAVGVNIPLDRLMRHCSLTEDQVLEAVQLASTTPQEDISIYIEKDHNGEQVIRLSKKIPTADLGAYDAKLEEALKARERRKTQNP